LLFYALAFSCVEQDCSISDEIDLHVAVTVVCDVVVYFFSSPSVLVMDFRLDHDYKKMETFFGSNTCYIQVILLKSKGIGYYGKATEFQVATLGLKSIG
jgi:hypothetical protein